MAVEATMNIDSASAMTAASAVADFDLLSSIQSNVSCFGELGHYADAEMAGAGSRER